MRAEVLRIVLKQGWMRLRSVQQTPLVAVSTLARQLLTCVVAPGNEKDKAGRKHGKHSCKQQSRDNEKKEYLHKTLGSLLDFCRPIRPESHEGRQTSSPAADPPKQPQPPFFCGGKRLQYLRRDVWERCCCYVYARDLKLDCSALRARPNQIPAMVYENTLSPHHPQSAMT